MKVCPNCGNKRIVHSHTTDYCECVDKHFYPKCGWNGDRKDLLDEEEYINKKRTKLIERMLE